MRLWAIFLKRDGCEFLGMVEAATYRKAIELATGRYHLPVDQLLIIPESPWPTFSLFYQNF